LNWNKRVRETHRWLSIAFTVAVIVNGVTVAQKKYTARLGLLAVFVLPYAAKWRSGSYITGDFVFGVLGRIRHVAPDGPSL